MEKHRRPGVVSELTIHLKLSGSDHKFHSLVYLLTLPVRSYDYTKAYDNEGAREKLCSSMHQIYHFSGSGHICPGGKLKSPFTYHLSRFPVVKFLVDLKHRVCVKSCVWKSVWYILNTKLKSLSSQTKQLQEVHFPSRSPAFGMIYTHIFLMIVTEVPLTGLDAWGCSPSEQQSLPEECTRSDMN